VMAGGAPIPRCPGSATGRALILSGNASGGLRVLDFPELHDMAHFTLQARLFLRHISEGYLHIVSKSRSWGKAKSGTPQEAHNPRLLLLLLGQTTGFHCTVTRLPACPSGPATWGSWLEAGSPRSASLPRCVTAVRVLPLMRLTCTPSEG
jgi:hypothetical protein